MGMPRRLGAEFFGTFWLTFAGCGSAVFEAPSMLMVPKSLFLSSR